VAGKGAGGKSRGLGFVEFNDHTDTHTLAGEGGGAGKGIELDSESGRGGGERRWVGGRGYW
jgi:hypothetical protein